MAPCLSHAASMNMFSTFSLKYKRCHMTCWQSIAREEFPWPKKVTFTSCILKLFQVNQLNWDWRKDYTPLFKFKCVQSITWGSLISCYTTCSPAAAAAAAAESLQSCPTLCDPIDGSPPGSPVPGILQARTLEWVAISFSNAWKWKRKWSRSIVPDS